jgi:hypothetical protein
MARVAAALRHAAALFDALGARRDLALARMLATSCGLPLAIEPPAPAATEPGAPHRNADDLPQAG